MIRRICLLTPFLAAGACTGDDVDLVPFSSERYPGALVYVDAEADCAERELEPPPPLTSNVIDGEIATVEITPQCGPVGTIHRVVVTVDEDLFDRVRAATVTVTPGASTDLDEDPELDARPELTFDMVPDGAFPAFGIELQSHGTPDEQRVDRLDFLLLQAAAFQPDPNDG